jgi:phage repressor protein C with HTH and peptisase S24 domain
MIKPKQSNQIKALLDFLDITQQEFAKQIEISQSAVSQLLNGRTTMSLETLEKISNTYDVDCNWLVTGKGDAFKKGGTITRTGPDILSVTIERNNQPVVALVPVKAQAGYAAGRVDTQYMEDLPTVTIPSPQFRNGTFRAFEVEGASMEPTLYKSDIIICRFVEDIRWMRDMYLYVVVVQGDVLVKRIYNRIRKDGTVILLSDNNFYPPMTLNADEIVEAWGVEARITSHFPPISETTAAQLRQVVDATTEAIPQA